MILTPEEQTEYREEIDYLIETRGYEYVWGKETTMDKVRGFSRDAPGKIVDAATRFVNNPTVIEINEKLKAHAEKMNAQEAEQRNEPTIQPRQTQRKQSHGNPRRQRQHREPSWQRGFVLDGDDHL